MDLGWASGAIALLGSIYFLLVYPISAAYKCGKNKKIGTVFRFFWITAIFVTGPLAAGLYFFRHPSGGASRWVATLSFAFLIASGVASIDRINHWVEVSDREITGSISPASLATAFQESVPEDQRQQLIQHFDEVHEQLTQLGWLSVFRRLTLFELEQSLFATRSQGKLNSDDVRFWESLYADRSSVGFVELEIRIQTRALTGGQI